MDNSKHNNGSFTNQLCVKLDDALYEWIRTFQSPQHLIRMLLVAEKFRMENGLQSTMSILCPDGQKVPRLGILSTEVA